MSVVKPRPVPRSHTLFALLLAVTLLVGCMDTPEDARPAQEDQTDDDIGVTDDPEALDSEEGRTDRAPYRFPLDVPIDLVHWENGSFSIEETGVGGGFVTGAFVQEVDLSDLLPREVPARVDIVVTLDAAAAPVVGPTGRIDPVGNGTTWYTVHEDRQGPDRFEMGGVVTREAAGTFGIALEAYVSGPADPPEVGYSVQATVTAHPDRVPVGVPVAAMFSANETIRFVTGANDELELLIYGPDDHLMDRHFFLGHEDWTVPSGAGGEYVVVPIHGSGDLRILHNGSGEGSAILRALGLRSETGAPHDLEPQGTVSWEFTLDRRPLRISLAVIGPSGTHWSCVGNLQIRLDAPSGSILAGTAGCPTPTNVPFMYEERWEWTSFFGDGRLVPGDYEVLVENTLWDGHHAVHTVEWYLR